MSPLITLSLFCLVLLSAPIHAQGNANILKSENASSETSLGRLIFSPAERRDIEANPERQEGDAPKKSNNLNFSSGNVSVKGLVTRSTGKNTVWINDAPYEHPPLLPNTKTNTSVQLAVPNLPTPVPVKPGQVYSPASGQVHEGFAVPKPVSQPTADTGNPKKIENEVDRVLDTPMMQAARISAAASSAKNQAPPVPAPASTQRK